VHPSTARQHAALRKIHEKYGSRCNVCGYDADERALHIDHVHGGGGADRRGGGLSYYLRVLKDTTGKYQLLCANCNEIKTHEKSERGGASQHRKRATQVGPIST
jgi:hypothetical protein